MRRFVGRRSFRRGKKLCYRVSIRQDTDSAEIACLLSFTSQIVTRNSDGPGGTPGRVAPAALVLKG